MFGRMTLGLAIETRAAHSRRGERCRLCQVPWPCKAYRLSQTAIAEITRRQPAIGTAQVHPSWIAGEATNGPAGSGR